MAFLFSCNFLSHIDRPHATIKKQVRQLLAASLVSSEKWNTQSIRIAQFPGITFC
jgi:hypothetical protein